eukprot:364547-Chlamydomonas_euryale.AAC.8
MSSRRFSTLCRRPAAARRSSCSPSSALTMPTCAGSLAWAGCRMAPSTGGGVAPAHADPQRSKAHAPRTGSQVA